MIAYIPRDQWESLVPFVSASYKPWDGDFMLFEHGPDVNP